MGRFVSDAESRVPGFELEIPEEVEETEALQFTDEEGEEEEEGSSPMGKYGDDENKERRRMRKKKKQVLLEGYVETNSEDDDPTVSRTKSLTDEDLDELKGCLDLGFGFSYEEIPELCNTLPALELCYSMSQKFMDDQHKSPESESASASSPPTAEIANWKISSPGDHPEDVKARLKYWAQAVACTVRLCS